MFDIKSSGLVLNLVTMYSTPTAKSLNCFTLLEPSLNSNSSVPFKFKVANIIRTKDSINNTISIKDTKNWRLNFIFFILDQKRKSGNDNNLALTHTEGVIQFNTYVILELAYSDILGFNALFLIKSLMSYTVSKKYHEHLEKSLELIMCIADSYNNHKVYCFFEVLQFLQEQ